MIEEHQLPKIGEGEDVLAQMRSTKKRSSEKSAGQSGAPADPVPDPEVSEKAPRPSALALSLLWSANRFARSCTAESADLAPAQSYTKLLGYGQYLRSMQTIYSILQITRGINGFQLAIGSL